MYLCRQAQEISVHTWIYSNINKLSSRNKQEPKFYWLYETIEATFCVFTPGRIRRQIITMIISSCIRLWPTSHTKLKPRYWYWKDTELRTKNGEEKFIHSPRPHARPYLLACTVNERQKAMKNVPSSVGRKIYTQDKNRVDEKKSYQNLAYSLRFGLLYKFR